MQIKVLLDWWSIGYGCDVEGEVIYGFYICHEIILS